MQTEQIEIDSTRRQVVDLTQELCGFCHARGDGLVSVFAPHSTAGLALMETGPRSNQDLVAVLQRLVSTSDGPGYQNGATAQEADQSLPMFASPSLVLPVQQGRPMLGAWQSLVLVDLNPDDSCRNVILSFLPG